MKVIDLSSNTFSLIPRIYPLSTGVTLTLNMRNEINNNLITGFTYNLDNDYVNITITGFTANVVSGDKYSIDLSISGITIYKGKGLFTYPNTPPQDIQNYKHVKITPTNKLKF